MKNEWARTPWLLLGLLPTALGLLAGTSWGSMSFWGMNALCSIVAAAGMLWGIVETKWLYAWLTTLVGCGLFFVNAGVVPLAGCVRMATG